MRKIAGLTLSAIFMCGVIACNSNPGNQEKDSMERAEDVNENKNLNEDDSKFVMKAAEMGMMEVEASKIAAERAVNADVKSFAQKMVEEHSKANAELKALAESKSITVPAEPTQDTKDAMEKLNKKTGADFDKEYMNNMVDDHKKTVDLFENAGKDCKDTDIRSFAAKTLPTLQMHLEMAQKTHDMVKDGKGNTNKGDANSNSHSGGQH